MRRVWNGGPGIRRGDSGIEPQLQRGGGFPRQGKEGKLYRSASSSSELVATCCLLFQMRMKVLP